MKEKLSTTFRGKVQQQQIDKQVRTLAIISNSLASRNNCKQTVLAGLATLATDRLWIQEFSTGDPCRVDRGERDTR